jgi:hypothetical protein
MLARGRLYEILPKLAKMTALAERRKFVRYMLPYGMLYVFDHYSSRVGWVKDVGMGGLSCEFNHGGEAEKLEVFDIFAYDPSNLYIPSVICERASEISVRRQRGFNQYLIITRYGQQFVSLTAEQKSAWQNLIGKLSNYSDSFTIVYNPLL